MTHRTKTRPHAQDRLLRYKPRNSGAHGNKYTCQKVSTYELETTTTKQTMARQEDAFITTRTLDETLLVGYNKAEPR